MSILGFRTLTPHDKELFRAELEKQRMEAVKLYKLNVRLQQLFRCACLAGDALRTGYLPISMLLRMCEGCCLMTRDEACESMDEVLKPGVTTLKEQPAEAKKWASRDVSQLSAVVRMMDRTLELNTVEDASAQTPLWSQRHRESRRNGLTKRRLHNSVAMHQLLEQLSDNATSRREIRTVTSAALQEIFSFVVEEGRDKCNYQEFVGLMILLARHFFVEEEQDHSFVFCVDCLWKHYLVPFVEEYSCNSVAAAVARAPLARFPGMSIVLEQFEEVLESLFKLFGLGQSIRLRSIQEMVVQSGLLAEFTHVTVDDVQATFLEAKRLGTSAAALLESRFGKEEQDDDAAKQHRARLILTSKIRLELERDQLDYFSFVDWLALFSTVCLAVEPRCTDYPTMGAKLEYVLRKLEPMYSDLVGMPMEEHIRPARCEPPKIISIEPNVVDCYSRVLVTVVGRNLPRHSVLLKFGSLLMISGAIDHDSGTFLCEVPQISKPENTEVRLSATEDDVRCLIRHYQQVPVSISEDGGRFFPFETDRPFTYEHIEEPISVRQYLPRLQRIYVQFATCNGKRPDDVDMTLDKWMQFCKEFRLLPPMSAVEDDTVFAAAQQLVTACFDQYAQKVKDPGQVKIEGVKLKEVLALDASLFPRAVIAWIVRSGQPVVTTLEEIMGNDLRAARERTIDVRELSLGPQALRIQRAAKKAAVIRRPENVNVIRTTSPRDARLHDLFEGNVLPGCAQGPGTVRARWQNENDHNRLLQRFLVNAESDIYFSGNISQYRTEVLPFHSTTLLRDSEPMKIESIASVSGGTAGTLSAVDEKEILHRAVQEAISSVQREQWNAALRREKAAAVRHSIQTDRLQLELEKEKKAKDALEKQIASGSLKGKDENAPLLSAGSAGVLQAEKEELHRIFVYELEKRKTKMQSDTLREEMLRDVERDRVIQNLRDQITDSSASFQRLQDVAMGQAQTIDKQADALRLLADRSTVLMADVMYFRSAQEKAIKVIAEDPLRAPLAAAMLEERKEHLFTVNQAASQMLLEAKETPMAKHPSAKELAKIPRQSKNALPPLPANFQPITLPKTSSVSVMLSAQEAEQQTNEVVEQVRLNYEKKMRDLVEQLAAAESRLAAQTSNQPPATGVENPDSSPSVELVVPPLMLSVQDLSEAQQTLSTPKLSPRLSKVQSPRGALEPKGAALSPRVSRTPRFRVELADLEVQTEAQSDATDYNLYSNCTMHAIIPGDTFESIARLYQVPLDRLFRANFVLPLDDLMPENQRREELQLLLHGIVSRSLRIPNGADAPVEPALPPPPLLVPVAGPNLDTQTTSPSKQERRTSKTQAAGKGKEPARGREEKKKPLPASVPQPQNDNRRNEKEERPSPSETSPLSIPPTVNQYENEALAREPPNPAPGTSALAEESCFPGHRSPSPFEEQGEVEHHEDALLAQTMEPPTLKPIIDLPNAIAVQFSVPSTAADSSQPSKRSNKVKATTPKPEVRRPVSDSRSDVNAPRSPGDESDQSLVRYGAALALESTEAVDAEPVVVHLKFRPSRVINQSQAQGESKSHRREMPEADCRALLVSPMSIEERSFVLFQKQHQDFFDSEAHHRLAIVLQAEKYFQGLMQKLWRAHEHTEQQLVQNIGEELRHDAKLAHREMLMRREMSQELVARGKMAEFEKARIDAARSRKEADRARIAESRAELELNRRLHASALAKEKALFATAAAERRLPRKIPPIAGRGLLSPIPEDGAQSPTEGISIPNAERIRKGAGDCQLVHVPEAPIGNAGCSAEQESQATAQVPQPVKNEMQSPASPSPPPTVTDITSKLLPLRMPPGLPRLAQEQIALVTLAEDLIRTKRVELERRPHTDGDVLSPLKRTPAKASTRRRLDGAA